MSSLGSLLLLETIYIYFYQVWKKSIKCAIFLAYRKHKYRQQKTEKGYTEAKLRFAKKRYNKMQL